MPAPWHIRRMQRERAQAQIPQVCSHMHVSLLPFLLPARSMFISPAQHSCIEAILICPFQSSQEERTSISPGCGGKFPRGGAALDHRWIKIAVNCPTGNGSDEHVGSGSNGQGGKHGSNMADRSGSGNDIKELKDGQGTSKINGNPAGAAS